MKSFRGSDEVRTHFGNCVSIEKKVSVFFPDFLKRILWHFLTRNHYQARAQTPEAEPRGAEGAVRRVG